VTNPPLSPGHHGASKNLPGGQRVTALVSLSQPADGEELYQQDRDYKA